MSSNTLPKLPAFRLKTLAATIASAMLFTSVQAAGLGELSVHSSLGQPLRAEVELLLNAKDEDGGLHVKLASADAYRQANIEFNAALSSLRFAIERRADRHIVRVTSAQPINEPFLDLLLEVSGGSGRVVREYVLLLDPPSLYATPAVQPNVSPNVSPQSARLEPRSESPRAPSQRKRDKPLDTPIERPVEKQAGGKARLTLSSATSLVPGRPAVNAEEYAAMEKSVTDANARVQSLEQKVDDLQRLLEATNGLLVEMQKQSELAKANAHTAPAASIATGPAPQQTAPAAAPAVKSPKPVAAADPGMDIAELLLPGAGLLAVLVGALGVFRMRRKRVKQAPGASLFADTGKEAASQSVPAGMPRTLSATSVLNPIPLSSAQVDPNEVDVVSEADVYIAFGRDVQAEQVLKEALRIQPQRHAARVKLLTIYAARRDLAAFELLAAELYSMTKGEGDEWAQAAAMGREIDPANPLYASARPAAANMVALEPAAPASALAPESAPEAPATKTEIGDFASTSEVDLTPLPQVELLPAEDDKPAARASNELDFNLSSLAAAEPEVPVIPSEPVFTPQPDADPVALDFEMPALSIPAAIEESAVPPATEAQPGSGPIDFDFLLPEILMATPKEVEAPATADVGLMDLEFLEPDAEEKPPR